MNSARNQERVKSKAWWLITTSSNRNANEPALEASSKLFPFITKLYVMSCKKKKKSRFACSPYLTTYSQYFQLVSSNLLRIPVFPWVSPIVSHNWLKRKWPHSFSSIYPQVLKSLKMFPYLPAKNISCWRSWEPCHWCRFHLSGVQTWFPSVCTPYSPLQWPKRD